MKLTEQELWRIIEAANRNVAIEHKFAAIQRVIDEAAAARKIS